MLTSIMLNVWSIITSCLTSRMLAKVDVISALVCIVVSGELILILTHLNPLQKQEVKGSAYGRMALLLPGGIVLGFEQLLFN